jgi:DNA-binding NarL/FixJ family response regulator
MIWILMADDHDVVRLGLRHMIEAQPTWQVVAEAEDGREVVQKALETKPDVAVTDYRLPLANGVEATRQIRRSATDSNFDHNKILIQELSEAAHAVTSSKPTLGVI